MTDVLPDGAVKAKPTQSARALFRATGNKAKPKTIRLLDGSYAKSDTVDRAENDFTPTPPEPTLALLHYERDRLKDFPLIWESACGDGRMMRDMRESGFACVGSDLIDRGCGALIQDYFKIMTPLSPCMITNPPYDKVNGRDGKCAWVWHAMETLGVDYMALLLNWSWPGAAATSDMWRRWPPARAYLMRWKIDFTGEGAPPMLNGWFIWDRKAAKGECKLLMMDRIDARQNNMFAEVAA